MRYSAYKKQGIQPGRLIPMVLLFVLLGACTPEDDHIEFVQLCDPQLGMGGYEHDKQTFTQAVKQINAMDADFAVICGDLVNHASDSSFADFNAIRDRLKMPCYLVPGNHDIGYVPSDSSLAVYREIFGRDYYTIRHRDVSFVFVNTQLWKTRTGIESVVHDDWLRSTLESVETADRVIVAGHYPLYIEDPAEEEAYFNLPGDIRTELLDLFSSNGVIAYLSGHKHETVINTYKGIQLVTGESTSRQFDERPLGFRHWTIYPDSVVHEFTALELDAVR